MGRQHDGVAVVRRDDRFAQLARVLRVSRRVMADASVGVGQVRERADRVPARIVRNGVIVNPIAKAIERNVPRDKIARALDINVRSISRKVQLLDGICEEVTGLLKDKMCPMAVFDVLRKMNPLRQIEAAELLINANNFSVSYASAILTGTPQAQLVTPQTPKRLKGMTAEAIARMERELSRLQEAISSIQDSYGQDHLHLTVVKGYLRKLITNDRVARYLAQHQPELLIEFQKIAEMTSTLPSEAA